MQEVVKHLLMIIETQKQVINYLCVLVFGKSFKPKAEKMTDKKYLKLSVDPLPIFEKPAILKIYECAVLIAENDIKPIKRRGSKIPPADTVCPYCGASSEYIYDNNGNLGQFLCKVCKSTFFPFKPTKDDEPYCPFCGAKLACIKERKDFDIYRCNNRDCSFRKKNLSAMTKAQKALYHQSPHLFKLRYIYRKFRFDFTPLSKENDCMPLVDLPNIGFTQCFGIDFDLPHKLRLTAGENRRIDV